MVVMTYSVKKLGRAEGDSRKKRGDKSKKRRVKIVSTRLKGELSSEADDSWVCLDLDGKH